MKKPKAEESFMTTTPNNKPPRFYANYMAMDSTLELAKCNYPKAEHEDIRCYVRADDYDDLQSRLEAAESFIRDMVRCLDRGLDIQANSAFHGEAKQKWGGGKHE